MESNASTTLVEFAKASFSYGKGRVLDAVDLVIRRGDFLGLVGPSGAGKTTILKAIVGDVRPVAGQVTRAGRGLRIGYVPQLETVDWHFPITVSELAFQGLVSESGIWPWPRRATKRNIDELLQRLGIRQLAGRQIRELSGGQQQRAFLARALIRRPDLLLLDEPTAGVDVATRREILDLLSSFNRDGIAVVLTTHDLNAVAARLPSIVCVNGRILAGGSPEDVLTPEVLRETFGSEMLVFHHHDALIAVDAPEHFEEHSHHVHLHDEHSEPEMHSGQTT